MSLIFFFFSSEYLFSQIEIACIGNSITAGYLLSNPVTESYPSQLQQKLGGGYIVYNYGANGKVLLNGFATSYTNSSQFALSILQHYDIVVICLGTNDTITQYHSAINEFVNDYKGLITDYNNFPSEDTPYYIICTPPPIFATYDGHSNTYLTSEIIPRINTVMNQTNSKKVDFYNTLINYPDMFIDGIHPNVNGAEKMAKKVKQAILAYLNPAPATPTNFSATGSINQVELTWDANSESDLNMYVIYRGIIDNGYKNLLVSLDKNNTSYTDTNVENHTIYYYQISATNTSNVSSARSAQVSATPGGPADTTAPETPTNFTAITNNGYIQLNWDLNTEDDLASYDIYRGVDDGGWKDLLANVNKYVNYYDDANIDPNETYYYQISAKDNNGNTSTRSNQISAVTLSIKTDRIVSDMDFIQNYPNPFNISTVIKYFLRNDTHVKISIYNILGNEIAAIEDGFKKAGVYKTSWNGVGDNKKEVNSGIYFLTFKTNGDFITKRLLLLK